MRKLLLKKFFMLNDKAFERIYIRMKIKSLIDENSIYYIKNYHKIIYMIIYIINISYNKEKDIFYF